MQNYPTVFDAITAVETASMGRVILALDESPAHGDFLAFAYKLFPDRVDMYGLTVGDVFRQYIKRNFNVDANPDGTVTLLDHEVKDSGLQFHPQVRDAMKLRHPPTWDELIMMAAVIGDHVILHSKPGKEAALHARVDEYFQKTGEVVRHGDNSVTLHRDAVLDSVLKFQPAVSMVLDTK